MVAYTFRCASCGAFDKHLPMGSAPPFLRCPRCGADAQRVWSAPGVVGMSPAGRARDAEERRNDRPRVVTAAPSPPSPAPLTDPRQKRLPRP